MVANNAAIIVAAEQSGRRQRGCQLGRTALSAVLAVLHCHQNMQCVGHTPAVGDTVVGKCGVQRVACADIFHYAKIDGAQACHRLGEAGRLVLGNMAAVIDDQVDIAIDGMEHGPDRYPVSLIDLAIRDPEALRPVRLHWLTVGPDDHRIRKAFCQPADRCTVQHPEFDCEADFAKPLGRCRCSDARNVCPSLVGSYRNDCILARVIQL